jgi:hypothetical protein
MLLALGITRTLLAHTSYTGMRCWHVTGVQHTAVLYWPAILHLCRAAAEVTLRLWGLWPQLHALVLTALTNRLLYLPACSRIFAVLLQSCRRGCGACGRSCTRWCWTLA